MPSQTDRLNTALAGRYRIERHLAVAVSGASPQPVANSPQLTAPSRYVIVQNWFTELKRLTSGTKQ